MNYDLDYWTNGLPRVNLIENMYINGYNIKFTEQILDVLDSVLGKGAVDREKTKSQLDSNVCQIYFTDTFYTNKAYYLIPEDKRRIIRDKIDLFLLDKPNE